jgi:LacI family transcriptional regulator
MTVSRVVNGDKNVREDTRAKVAASIKALQYSPNMAARSLATADAVRIGVLHSNPSSAYLSEFLVGSLEQSSLNGCQLVVEKCDGPGSEKAAIEKLAHSNTDGVILPPPLCDSTEALKAVKDADLPAVVVATGRRTAGLSSVSINDFDAARAMTRYLASLGHRRVAFVRGHPNQSISDERYQGFVAGMAEAGLPIDPRLVVQGFFTYRSGLEAAESLLAGPLGISAIFASNDDMAAAAVAVAHRMGLEVPQDLTIVGFDDTPLALTVWPALTTVRQPIADMARNAVMLLLEQIRSRRAGGGRLPDAQRVLAYTLIHRESSDVERQGAAPRRRETLRTLL